MAYIVFRDIMKNYGECPIFDNFNLSIEKGEFVTLLGPSGCGKSTLLRCLAGLEPVAGGSIFLDGQNITNLSPGKRNIGMIFQQYSLFPTMNVYKNIAFGLKMKNTGKAQIKKKVSDALELVELSGFEDKFPSQLSGGEQQRVALARCIVVEPKVLLLDEPFSAIDAKLRKALQVRIREIHNRLGITSVFVTHDQDEAMTMSDTIHLINSGKLVQSGTPTDLYAHPKTKFSAGFMGNYNWLTPEVFPDLFDGENRRETAAIRPELMRISTTAGSINENELCFNAQIAEIVPQGTITRYRFGAKYSDIWADVLFTGQESFCRGQDVYVSINKNDIIFNLD